MDSLCKEIALRRDEISGTLDTNTLYIGGGTPSVLPLYMHKRIVDELGKFCGNFTEFTVESNPEDVVNKGVEYIRGLKSLGVDRISMGVQSFDDSILRWMNRRHSATQAVEAFNIIREGGIDNISIDLIFGITDLADSQWEDSIQKAVSLSPDHISAYQLSVESGSILEKKIEKGQYVEADDNLCRRQYDILCKRLKENGFVHYEVSNFAKPGREAKHNSAYWKRVPYVGLGASAHSFLKDGEKELRIWNTDSIPLYSSDREVLTKEDLRVETIMLGLRTANGVPRKYLYENCDPKTIEDMIGRGLLVENPEIHDNIRIPENQFFVSDNIISDII